MKTNEIIKELKSLKCDEKCICSPDPAATINKAIAKLEALEKDREALFRLGQMDMQESVVTMLKNAADNTFGITRSTLRDAAKAVSEMETGCG